MLDETKSDDINLRIARRVHALRSSQGLALQALAERSGVSRSMISAIERGQSSPTAVVLDKLAQGLGTTLAALFDVSPVSRQAPEPLARLAQQAVWRDPQTGYVRRQVSPAGFPSPMQIVEVHFPAGQQVRYDNAGVPRQVHQQVWVIEGRIEVTANGQAHVLKAGDCLAMSLDEPTHFHNRSRHPARYAVVISNPLFKPS